MNYADDFVICCRGNASQAMDAMRRMIECLKLTVNESKTRQCRVPEESFHFLGYTLGTCHSPRTGRAYLGTTPRQEKVAGLCREIHDMTDRRWCWKEAQDLVQAINRKLIGWSNYFCLGPVSKAYRRIDLYTRERLHQWLRIKHKIRDRRNSRFSDDYLYQELGLVRLCNRTRNFPWAKT